MKKRVTNAAMAVAILDERSLTQRLSTTKILLDECRHIFLLCCKIRVRARMPSLALQIAQTRQAAAARCEYIFSEKAAATSGKIGQRGRAPAFSSSSSSLFSAYKDRLMKDNENSVRRRRRVGAHELKKGGGGARRMSGDVNGELIMKRQAADSTRKRRQPPRSRALVTVQAAATAGHTLDLTSSSRRSQLMPFRRASAAAALNGARLAACTARRKLRATARPLHRSPAPPLARSQTLFASEESGNAAAQRSLKQRARAKHAPKASLNVAAARRRARSFDIFSPNKRRAEISHVSATRRRLAKRTLLFAFVDAPSPSRSALQRKKAAADEQQQKNSLS